MTNEPRPISDKTMAGRPAGLNRPAAATCECSLCVLAEPVEPAEPDASQWLDEAFARVDSSESEPALVVFAHDLGQECDCTECAAGPAEPADCNNYRESFREDECVCGLGKWQHGKGTEPAEPAPAPTDDQVLAHVFRGEHDASVQAIVDGLAGVGPREPTEPSPLIHEVGGCAECAAGPAEPAERLRESVDRLEAERVPAEPVATCECSRCVPWIRANPAIGVTVQPAEPTERTGPATTADPDASRKAVLPDWRFLTKDSGTRVDFPTGSRRDDATGKGRFDLLPFEAVNRYAQLLERGAVKYDARNWEKGQPFSRVFSSLLRHAHQAAAGMSDEDHLAAVMFNAAALITFAERIARGELPDELNDMPWAA